MATLPDVLRAEMARCQNLAQTYQQLGTAGAFALALLTVSLDEAGRALRSHEGPAIEQALQRLRAFRDVAPDLPSAGTAAQSRPSLLPQRAPGPRPPQRAAAPSAYGASPQARLQEQFFTWTRAA